MTRRKIVFEAWGRNIQTLRMPSYALAHPWDNRADAVAAAIARRNRLVVVTVRDDGTAYKHGKPDAYYYQITLARPLADRLGGGYGDIHECWIAIPVSKQDQ